MAQHTQQRANEADNLLTNPLLKQARDAVQETIVNRITAGDADPANDHELCNMLRAGVLYHRMLEKYLRTGDVELHNAEQRKRVA